MNKFSRDNKASTISNMSESHMGLLMILLSCLFVGVPFLLIDFITFFINLIYYFVDDP